VNGKYVVRLQIVNAVYARFRPCEAFTVALQHFKSSSHGVDEVLDRRYCCGPLGAANLISQTCYAPDISRNLAILCTSIYLLKSTKCSDASPASCNKRIDTVRSGVYEVQSNAFFFLRTITCGCFAVYTVAVEGFCCRP
jgi:hypothetical protein